MRKDYMPAASAKSEREFVAEFWDRHWRDQAQTSERQRRLRRGEEYQFLRRIIPDLPSRKLDILDCGCRLGDWTLMFQADGHRAVGLDIAAETVGRLRKEYGETFRLGDFLKIDSPDASFDLVINWGGIEHFEEGPVAALHEAFRVLRPGGVFVATTPCDNLRMFLLDAWGGRTAGPGFPLSGFRFYQYRFTWAELEGYFRACGFQTVQSRIISGDQGVHRCLQHELGWLGRRVPRVVQAGIEWAGGWLLRLFLGHMVICAGRKASEI
jgi:SAM-dependent methyltransferase